MNYKKFLIEVDTAWSDTENSYSAIAESEDELWEIAEELAYTNFLESDGDSMVLDKLFPEQGDEEYTEEQLELAYEEYSEHYWSNIKEVNEENEEQLEKFENSELVYDSGDE